MKTQLLILALCASAVPHWAPVHAQSATDVHAVAPALETYTARLIEGDLWRRSDLGLRDRSLVTVAALVAMDQTAMLKAELTRALDDGVRPAEIGAVLTHLAFYAGWPNALSAVAVAKPIFAARGIGADQLGEVGEMLPIDEAADRQRAAGVKAYGAVSPAIVAYTNGVLFNDLWRRPDLSPRDRSLVTIAALIAAGHAEQLTFHLNRGMDNGLTPAQLGEVITQLAFYAGWPTVLSAVPVAKAVFDKRSG